MKATPRTESANSTPKKKRSKKWIRLKRNFGISQTNLAFLGVLIFHVSQLHIAILTFTENFELFFNNPFESFSDFARTRWMKKMNKYGKQNFYKFEGEKTRAGFCLQFKGLFRFRKNPRIKWRNTGFFFFPLNYRKRAQYCAGDRTEEMGILCFVR